MCGITTDYITNVIKSFHTWTYAGDPKYFPYENMICDCGLTKYNKDRETRFFDKLRHSDPKISGV